LNVRSQYSSGPLAKDKVYSVYPGSQVTQSLGELRPLSQQLFQLVQLFQAFGAGREHRRAAGT